MLALVLVIENKVLENWIPFVFANWAESGGNPEVRQSACRLFAIITLESLYFKSEVYPRFSYCKMNHYRSEY